MTDQEACGETRHGHTCVLTEPHDWHEARYVNDEGTSCRLHWRSDAMTRPRGDQP